MFDEELPQNKKEHSFPRNLENLSVSDLQDYIEELEQEKERVMQDMEKKKSSQDAANSFFKS